MTAAEIRALHIDIFDRMVAAGWLVRYTETDGEGFHLTWSVRGGAASRILLLAPDLDRGPGKMLLLVLLYGLKPDIRSAADIVNPIFERYVVRGLMSRYRFVHGVVSDYELTEAGAEWRQRLIALLGELGIEPANAAQVRWLCEIAVTWAPDADTKFVVGP